MKDRVRKVAGKVSSVLGKRGRGVFEAGKRKLGKGHVEEVDEEEAEEEEEEVPRWKKELDMGAKGLLDEMDLDGDFALPVPPPAKKARLSGKAPLQEISQPTAASMPVVKMGRMAGQFAKPRSSDTETRGDVTLPAYRGDIVNGYDFTEESRKADPARLLKGYHTAASTLNLIRAFTQGGFADLREVHSWNKGFASNPANQAYERMAAEIDRAIKFMEAAGANFDELTRVEFYTGHEGLLMDYERPMTRIDSRTGLPYNTSSHFQWIGERTRELDGAHVDYFSKIRNPIGVKLGPSTTPEAALALIDKLDPEREPGRLTFITRMGAGTIRDALPPLLEAVRDAGATPLWVTDPMHGNGITTPTGYKTRRFDDVVDEVRGFFDAHRQVGTHPGGIHVELTGDDVTECLGGSEMIDEATLATRYESLCDPRLNHRQSLELAFLVAEELENR